MATRSFDSVVTATFQPLPTSPTTWSAGISMPSTWIGPDWLPRSPRASHSEGCDCTCSPSITKTAAAISWRISAGTTRSSPCPPTIATAVEATQRGAFDFLEKPLDADRLLVTVRNAIERAELLGENHRLREEG